MMLRKHILLIAALFFIQESSFAQFFEQANFVGAVGSVNWTAGWTDYSPTNTTFDDSKKLKVSLTGRFNKDVTLYNNTVYTLKGPVYIDSGAILYIEPGTHILGDPATVGALIIMKGAKIIANGTKEQPIVFTSGNPVGKRNPGDWGGIVLMGDAKVNTPSGSAVLEGPNNPPKYGGKNDFDNSGIMRYVRIEFAGKKIGPDREMNGLSLCGVGSSTVLEYIMISFSKDDSFEFYGGTVNARYIISNRCTDDDFDITLGYRGNIQYAIVLRHHLITDAEGSRALEIDSYQDQNQKYMGLISAPKISNVTVVSPEQIVGKQASPKLDQVIKLYKGGAAHISNSLFVGFPVCYHAEGAELTTLFKDGVIKFHNNVLVGIKKPVESLDIKAEEFDINSWFIEPKKENHIVNSSQITSIFETTFTPATPNFEVSRKLGYKPSYEDLPTQKPEGLPFFVKTNFIGAFGSENWTAGWTNLKPNSEEYPEADTVLKGTITQNLTLTQGKTYLLKGDVIVADNVTLTIEAGVIVKGETASKATLIVAAEGKIIAEGTVEKPIIFTSDQAKGKRTPGSWGGIVILGKSRIYTAKPVMTAKDVEGWLPASLSLAGLQQNEDRVSIKYVRIEFAGGAKTKEFTLAGLICAGVSKATLENIQVSMSGNDGFEFIGGSATGKNLFSYHSIDDDFSVSDGYNGELQFGLVVRDPSKAAPDGAYAIDFSKYSNYTNVTDLPNLSNFTIIGPKMNNPPSINQNYRTGVTAIENAAFHFRNSVIAGYDNSINVSGAGSTYFLKSGLATFVNNVISGSKSDAVFLKDSKADKSMETMILKNAVYKNTVLVSNAELKLNDSFQPNSNSPLLNASYVE